MSRNNRISRRQPRNASNNTTPRNTRDGSGFHEQEDSGTLMHGEHFYDVDEVEEDIEREFMGERIYDPEEREAEEEGEELFVADENEYVAGAVEERRERQIFETMGLNVDAYDTEVIDDEQYAPMSPRHRRAVDNLLDYRDYRQQRDGQYVQRGQLSENLLRQLNLDNVEDQERFHDIEERVERRRRMRMAAAHIIETDATSLDSAKIALQSGAKEKVFDEHLQQAVDTCFRYFLYKFSLKEIDEESSDSSPFYVQKMEKMILDESTSLYVSATHLFRFHCENLLKWIEHKPAQVLGVMNDTLAVEVQQQNAELFTKLFKDSSFKTIITDWPYSTDLRHLRCNDLNSLIRISGVITRRGNVLPKLKTMYLTCSRCGVTMSEYPIYYEKNSKLEFPKSCLNCQGGTFTVNRLRTVYSDYQRLTLQESPGTVPAGLVARQKELIVTGELVDTVKPGEEVEALGIYKTKYDTGLNIKMGFPVFATEIEVNNIVRKEEVRYSELTMEDIREIKKLSKDPNIRERIIASIAPSIWGHKPLKTALAYALFGGVTKGTFLSFDTRLQNGALPSPSNNYSPTNPHVIRGDINVLLLGDPGLGKSQALQYIHKTFPRTVLTNGKGASAAGLTAGVRREPSTGEWMLEGGALVLADEGICLIDEFDKMTEKDRVSIHEAMEQQTISISKAGINTTLKARCSVIAAANPKHGGRYESSYTFKENVDLSDPILTRFDLIIVMKDIPNIDEDYYLAQFVCTNHQLNHPELSNSEDYENRMKELINSMRSAQAYEPIDQELLQKYIIYARKSCRPNVDTLMDKEINEKMVNFYAKIRQRAASTGGLSFTLRHVESMIRISEANAKMRLSDKVTSRDVDYAIATMLDSFISSQKYAVASRLGREFARYRALARGGYDMLVEIVRRGMQHSVQSQSWRNAARSQQHSTIATAASSRKEGERGEAKLLLDTFMRHAKQNKFSAYQVESWFQTDSFKKRFALTKIGKNTYIQCTDLFHGTPTNGATVLGTIGLSADEKENIDDYYNGELVDLIVE